MLCATCHATADDSAAFCPACGTPLHAAAAAPGAAPAAPPAAAPITAAQLDATAQAAVAQLRTARRSLPFGSVHVAAAASAVVALLLGMTSWGDRPSWLLGLLTLAGIGVTLAADLRRRGAFTAAGWPLAEAQERAVAAATLVLLTAATVETLHLRLGSLFWLVALGAFGWGAWEWLAPHADVRPRRLLGGYRGLALGGVVVLLAAMTQTFGQTATTYVPDFSYTGTFYFGIPYSGMAVEWAEPVVVLVVAGALSLLAAGAWRPAWWRLLAPGTAALAALWLLVSLATSTLMKSGGRQLAFWLALVGAAGFLAGSALIALGHEDGAYTPAKLIERARRERRARWAAAETPPQG